MHSINCPQAPVTSPVSRLNLQPSAAPHNQTKPVLDRHEAAEFLGVKPQTLAAWACNKRVLLPYVKIGRRVVYRRQDLDAFCAANVVGLDQAGVKHG